MAAVPPSHPAALTQAHALHKQGRLAEAEVLYRQVLKGQPRQVDALQLLALIEAQNQRHVEALSLFDAALKLRPDLVSAWVNRGVALQALNRNHDALVSYERALACQPGHPTAQFKRATPLAGGTGTVVQVGFRATRPGEVTIFVENLSLSSGTMQSPVPLAGAVRVTVTP